MTKTVFLFVFLILSGPFAFACDTPPSDAFLRKMLHEGKVPTKWRTVKGKSYKANRSIDALGVVARTQEESYAVYKGKRHYIDNVTFCRVGENKLKGTHPKHGTVRVTRTGKGKKSMLAVRYGALKTNLRLNQYVKR